MGNVPEYDLCVIGGGINGAGIARDAAGRGLSVLLVEARDLAQATSSSSTKLIHGGLRYLEYYEFALVRESLKEREVLLSLAPHIIRPQEFILPHDKAQRPYWMIRAGLFLYDHLAKRRKLPGSHGVNISDGILKKTYSKGFSYTDCWVDDARLVVLNAMSAREKGADIRTHTRCTGLKCEGGRWIVSLEGGAQVRAAMVINAAGPWVGDFIVGAGLGAPEVPKVKLVKGSHIIIKRAYEGDHAYILQQPDGRIVFAIPYEQHYTLVGTTDENFTGDAYAAKISDAEFDYLCAAFNRSFVQQISKDDVLWTYSGVRPLFDDGGENASAVTRDYRLYRHKELDAPLVSVFGGKLTTYRVLAQEAVDRVLKMAERSLPHWSAGEALPGGDVPGGDFAAFLKGQIDQYPWLSIDLLERYAHAYGTRMDLMLQGASDMDGLGWHFGDHVYEAEVKYLLAHEFANSAEDILWRRSKLGLHVAAETAAALEAGLPKMLEGI